MTHPFLSFARMTESFMLEEDWLFEKLLQKLNSHRHVLISAEENWGVQDYMKELGFQLEETYRDIRICYLDVGLAGTSESFLRLFQTTLLHRFDEPEFLAEAGPGSMATLKLPGVIARKKGIRVAVFLSNIHLFRRFKDADSFLRKLRLYFKNQKKCIFCLYGNDSRYLRDLVQAPGPLSGLGQFFKLSHDPSKHRSACIRKLFHEQHRNIDFRASIHMSFKVDNHPVYLKLLSWHALIRTRNLCTMATVDEAFLDLVLQFENHFLRMVENLTKMQVNYLKARLEAGCKICSEANLKAYQLGSSAHVTRVKTSLVNRGILYQRRGDPVFVDPVFREWLRIRYFKAGPVPGKSL